MTPSGHANTTLAQLHIDYCAETFLHSIQSTKTLLMIMNLQECDSFEIRKSACRSDYGSGTREQGQYSDSYPLICESLLSWAWELVSTTTSEKRLSFTHCNRREQNCCWKPWGRKTDIISSSTATFSTSHDLIPAYM